MGEEYQTRFGRVRALETALGDPFDPTSVLAHATSATWDEEEHFPREALDLLASVGVARDFVPVAHGGDLRAYDELVGIARLIAARNMTVAVTMSAMIWSTLIWVAGDKEQRRRHAESILAFRTPCLAYSEEAHGADLLGNDTIARRVDGGYLISGRKWPINRATTGQSVVLLARTGEKDHPRGLSLFWFEKSDLDAARWSTLPPVKTLGVRGTDISGIELNEAFVPETSRIGPEGAGLEIALKGLHVTRTLCTGLSLGAVESAVRTTVRLAETRRLYGDVLFALPYVRNTIVDAYAMFLGLEAASLGIARHLHVSPSQAATISATSKYAVPRLSEDALQRLATVHGARFFMRDHHDWGVMQKVYRDNLLIAIFDGATPVNLSSLATQLPLLARSTPTALGGNATDPALETAAYERAAVACTISVDPPPFDGSGLDLAPRSDDIVGSYDRLRKEVHGGLEPGAMRDRLIPLLDAVHAAIVEVFQDLKAFETARRGRRATGGFVDGAERFAVLYIAVAAIHVWWRERKNALASRPDGWLVLSLRQMLRTIGIKVAIDPADLESVYDALVVDLRRRSQTAGTYSLFC